VNGRYIDMARKYPTRPNSHNLETLSERFFVQSLPLNWASDKPSNDYGVDLRVDIFEDDQATGLELLVQLKSSQNASENETETISLSLKTYNHLWDKLQVVMLVKYIEAINEAYWLLMKDIPQPNQEHKTFTVHFPKENTLSTIDWNEIQEYVRQVTDDKLAAQRAKQQQQRK
jgi:hypothetical protein